MKYRSDADSTTHDVTTTDDPEVIAAVRAVNATGQALSRATDDNKTAREHLVKLLETRGGSSLFVEIDGVVYKATVVRSEYARADDEALRKALGVRKFRSITSSKVDHALLNQAVLDGKIPAEMLRFVTLVPRAAWPKVTEVERRARE